MRTHQVTGNRPLLHEHVLLHLVDSTIFTYKSVTSISVSYMGLFIDFHIIGG